jgi:hypothetical protein
MNKIRKQYPELIITLIPRKYKAKDISDFYKLYGKDKTVKLIKNTIIKWQKSRQILV